MKILIFIIVMLVSIRAQAQDNKKDKVSLMYVFHEIKTPNIPKKKFHLYLLAGQSNMSGRGRVEAIDTTPNRHVYTLNKNMEWELAKDPIHFDKPSAGVGPGLAFGKTLAMEDTSVCIGLIPAGIGGAGIDSWVPGAYYESTQSYPYDDAVKRMHFAMNYGVVKGILWQHGGSDALPGKCEVYEGKLIELIARFRKEARNKNIPFIAGLIPDYILNQEGGIYAQKINDALVSVAGKVDNYVYISSTGLMHRGDGVHFNSASARELGNRFAREISNMNSKK